MNKKRAAPKPPPRTAGVTSKQAEAGASAEREAPVPKSRKDIPKPSAQEIPKPEEPNAVEQTEKVKKEETPKNFPENVTLKIVLPDQTVKESVFPSSTAMIDLRMQLCARYKLPLSSYILEPIRLSDGRSIPYQPSHTLASLAAEAVAFKSKIKEPTQVLPPKVPEQTVRLTIKMSRNQQQVLRVSPRSPLSKIIPQIMEKFSVSADSQPFMQLRHPEQTDMTLDTSRSLDDYKIRELFLADKRAQNSVSSVTIEDIPHYEEDKVHSPSISTSEKEKKGVLRLSSLFKRSKKHKQKKDGSVSPTSPPLSVAKSAAPLQQQPVQQKTTNSNNSNSKVQEEMPEKKKRSAPVKPVSSENDAVTKEAVQSEISSKLESTESLHSDLEEGRKIEEEYHELHEGLPKVKARTKRKAPPVPPLRTSILSSAEANHSPNVSERSVKKKAPTPPGMHSREESNASAESSSEQIENTVDGSEPTPKEDGSEPASPKQKPTKPPRKPSIDPNSKEVQEPVAVADVQVEIQEQNDDIHAVFDDERAEIVAEYVQEAQAAGGNIKQESADDQAEEKKLSDEEERHVYRKTEPVDEDHDLDVNIGVVDGLAKEVKEIIDSSQSFQSGNPDSANDDTAIEEAAQEVQDASSDEENSDTDDNDNTRAPPPTPIDFMDHEKLDKKNVNNPIDARAGDEDSSETRNVLTDSMEKAVDHIDRVLETENDKDSVADVNELPEDESTVVLVEKTVEHDHTSVTEETVQPETADENQNSTWRDEDGIEVIDLVTKKTEEEIQLPSLPESQRSESPPSVEDVLPAVEDMPKKVLTFEPNMLDQDQDDGRDDIISPEKHFDPDFGQATPIDDFDFMTNETKAEKNEQARSEDVSTEITVPKDNEIEIGENSSKISMSLSNEDIKESFPLPLPEEIQSRNSTPSPPPEPAITEKASTVEPPASPEQEYLEEDIDEGTVDPDDETVQEIEKLKAQIARMRQKKAAKALEESKPFKIIRETNTKGPKTFTFVPNQRKAVYKDYDVAPSIGINLTESGEIKGFGAPILVEEGDMKETVPLAFKPEPAPKKKVIVVSETPKTENSDKPMTKPESLNNGKAEIPYMIPDVKVIENSSSKMPAQDPKKVGGYVSSAALRQNSVDSDIRPKTSSANMDDDSLKRRTTLPNYYKRFLGVQSFKSAVEEKNNDKPDSRIKPAVSAKIVDQHKVIEAVYKDPKKQDGTLIVKKLVQPEDLPPPPPPENNTPLQASSAVTNHDIDDFPLPPPPDDFLSPVEEKNNVFQSPKKQYGNSSSSSFDSSEQVSPASPSSNPNLSPTYLGVASAKPFSPMGFGGKTKFRPMSSVLQDEPNSFQHDFDTNNNREVVSANERKKGAVIYAKSKLNLGDSIKQSNVHANAGNQSPNKLDNSKKQNLSDYEAREAILKSIQQGSARSTLKKTRKIENTRTVVPNESK